MIIDKKEYRAVWRDKKLVYFIDQTKLPFKLEIKVSKNYNETCDAIKSMVVRGAPAIGVAGAYAYVQAAYEFLKDAHKMKEAVKSIQSTRPTAVDLFNILERMNGTSRNLKALEEESEKIAEEVVAACRKIGEIGTQIVPKKASILTHCHTGALATIDYGTALAIIKEAHHKKRGIFVYVSETRPRIQGALTSWELLNEKVPHKVIVDSACGSIIEKGEIDLVIVGADRICLNGDFANKIGTYAIAVLAKENKVPFYVAAPITSFDFKLKSGKDMGIEKRSKEEILSIRRVRIYPKGTEVYNPAFDVTPYKYVKGYITEYGIFKSIKELKKKLNMS